MPTKVYWVHGFENSARIGIMARPRGENWLEDEIINLSRNKVNVLVSLLEDTEISELKLDQEDYYCASQDIRFINFPIPDRGIPKDKIQVNQLVEKLALELSNGRSVVIHCRMGIGRSSIVAAAVLKRYNYKPDEIIGNISAIRGLKVPDTEQQMTWLKSI